MSVLVIGGKSGQLTRALMRRAQVRDIQLEAFGRPDIDLEQSEAAAAFILARKPKIVINAAAYTKVDDAQRDEARARQINATAPGAIARAAAQIGAAFCHVSTDYVFPGDGKRPYVERDATGPLSVYGKTKLEGEAGVASAHPDALILRTAWVYDASGVNFVRTMLGVAAKQDEAPGVDDELGSPTFSTDLADAALQLCARGASGIYHCAGAGEASRADFAQEIFALSAARGGPSARVKRLSAAAFAAQDPKAALRAPRPANSRLDCSKLAADHKLTMRDWRDALAECMDEIAELEGWRTP